MTFAFTQDTAHRRILRDLEDYLRREVQLRWEPKVAFDLGGDNGDRVIGVRIEDLSYKHGDFFWTEDDLPWGLALCTVINRNTIELMTTEEPSVVGRVRSVYRNAVAMAINAQMDERETDRTARNRDLMTGPENQTPTLPLDFSEIVKAVRELATDDEKSLYNRALVDLLAQLVSNHVGATEVAETLLEGTL